MAEIKSIDDGIRAIQYLRHLMKQLGLPDIEYPTPLMNDNQGSIDWIESGCKPTKKLRHKNLSKLGIKEAREHKEVQLYWMAGATNPDYLFTKEDNDVKHCKTLRDQMVTSWEAFANSSTSTETSNEINSNPDILWGVLERGLEDHNSEELTPLTNSKSMSDTQQKQSYISILKSSTHKDPNLSVRFHGCGSNRL